MFSYREEQGVKMGGHQIQEALSNAVEIEDSPSRRAGALMGPKPDNSLRSYGCNRDFGRMKKLLI
jgi:hypothetical protein